MTTREIIASIESKYPELEKKISIENVRYNRGTNHAVFYMTSDVLIGRDRFETVKKLIQSFFSDTRVSLRVASPSLGMLFLEEPQVYAAPILQYLVKHYPSVTAWQKQMVWKNENGDILNVNPNIFS